MARLKYDPFLLALFLRANRTFHPAERSFPHAAEAVCLNSTACGQRTDDSAQWVGLSLQRVLQLPYPKCVRYSHFSMEKRGANAH